MVGPERLQDELVQVVLFRGKMLDEGLLGEGLLDRILVVDLLLVDRIKDPQVILVAGLK